MSRDNAAQMHRLGDFLLEKGMITREQLDLALTVQAQSKMRLGSILLNLGFLLPDDLLDFLAKRTSHAALDLYKLNLSPEVLGILPFRIMKKHKILPIAIGEKAVFVAMVIPSDLEAINELKFILGKAIEPIVVPEGQMNLAIEYLEKRGGRLDHPLIGVDLERMQKQLVVENNSNELLGLFTMLVEQQASDLLFTAGVPPSLKKHNEMIRLNMPPLTPKMTQEFAFELMTEEQKDELEKTGSVDFAYIFQDLGRFRLNIYRQRNSIACVARRIVDVIPSGAELGLPGWLADFALKRQGLILITGPTGQGKTTTLSSLVELINSQRKCNIITLEDPIEYVHKHRLASISQREVGQDTTSYLQGLKHIFRQSPDVVVIGELRDMETFEVAIKAAETGHLVLTTFHATTSTSAVERLIDFNPPEKQNQARVQLSDNLIIILNQRLLPQRSGTGRVLALESLIASSRVRHLIREGKTHQIRSLYQQAANDFIPLDISLVQLVRKGKITREDGLAYCIDANFYQNILAKGS